MLHVHSLTFHARLRQTKTTNCPPVSRCSFSFTSFREISFSFTTANVNEKRLDRVRDGCEIDSRVKRLYCFTGAERGRTQRRNFDNTRNWGQCPIYCLRRAVLWNFWNFAFEIVRILRSISQRYFVSAIDFVSHFFSRILCLFIWVIFISRANGN